MNKKIIAGLLGSAAMTVTLVGGVAPVSAAPQGKPASVVMSTRADSDSSMSPALQAELNKIASPKALKLGWGKARFTGSNAANDSTMEYWRMKPGEFSVSYNVSANKAATVADANAIFDSIGSSFNAPPTSKIVKISDLTKMTQRYGPNKRQITATYIMSSKGYTYVGGKSKPSTVRFKGRMVVVQNGTHISSATLVKSGPKKFKSPTLSQLANVAWKATLIEDVPVVTPADYK